MLTQELMAGLSHSDSELQTKDRKLAWSTARIEQLAHEMAVLKRWKFSARSEQFDAAQKSQLDEEADAGIAAVELELDSLGSTLLPAERQQPRRAPLPPHLPRTVLHHEPESTVCSCGCALKRVGEDISEKLDYTPGVFTVERHIRGKWACAKCQSLVQAPVPAQVIDKGRPTAGLLAQVLVAKYADHLPLHRQEGIFARAGMALSRSTLAEWVGTCGVQLQPLVDALKQEVLGHGVLHADETPVAMLAPGKKKTHKAYLWAYCPGVFEGMRAVIYDFAQSRTGEHARAFLQREGEAWQGKLVCDDYAGYKASFTQGIVEVRLRGTCQAQVLRVAREHAERDGSQGAGVLWQAVCDRARGGRPRRGAAHSTSSGECSTGGRRPAHLDARATPARDRRNSFGQSSGLQLEALGGTDSIPRRWATTHRQQLGGEPDTAHRNRTLELAVRRLVAWGPAGCCCHGPGAVGPPQWA